MKHASTTQEDGPYAAKGFPKPLYTRYVALRFVENACPFVLCVIVVDEAVMLPFHGPSDGVLFVSLRVWLYGDLYVCEAVS